MGALPNNSTAFAMSGVAQKQVAKKVGPVHMEFECGEAWACRRSNQASHRSKLLQTHRRCHKGIEADV